MVVRLVEMKMHKDGEAEQNGLQHDAAPGLGHGKHTEQSDLAEINAHHGLEKGPRIVSAQAVGALPKDVGCVVQKRNVEQQKADKGEEHDDRSDDAVRQEDHGQVGVDRERCAPRKAADVVEPGPELSGGVVEHGTVEIKQDQTHHLEQRTAGDGKALQHHVGDVEVGRLWQVGRKQLHRLGGLICDLGHSRRKGGRDGGDQEHLDDLERKVGLLGEVLYALGRETAGHLAHLPDEDRQQQHQHRQHDRWQQRRDQAQQHVRQPVDELEPVHFVGQVREVGHETDKRDRDRPEHDQGHDRGHRAMEPHEPFPPEDPHVGPVDVLWADVGVFWREEVRQVVDRGLERELRVVLVFELDRDRVHGPCAGERGLVLLDLLVETGQLLFAVLDGVDLLAEDGHADAHLGPFFVRHVRREVVRVLDDAALFVGLEFRLDGALEQLCQGGFERVGQPLSLLERAGQPSVSPGDPDPLDTLEQLEELLLVEILVGDGLENDRSGAELFRVRRRREHEVAQAGVEVQLAVDHKQHHAVEDPRHEHVGVVPAGRVDVGDAQLVEAVLALAVCGVHRQQNGPCGDPSQGNGGHDKQVPQKQIPVDSGLLDDEGGRLSEQDKDPGQRVLRQRVGLLAVGHNVEAGLWLVDALELESEQQKQRHEHGADHAVRHDRREHVLGRRVFRVRHGAKEKMLLLCLRSETACKFSVSRTPASRSEKVVRDGFLGRDLGAVLQHAVEDGVAAVEVVVEGEHGGDVAAAVAVVGRRPHGHQAAVKHLLVALHDQLVGARDEAEVVLEQKPLGLGVAEQVPGAARRHRPGRDVLLGVRPQQVAHEPVVRDLLLAVDQPDLVDRLDRRAQAAVHAQHAAVRARPAQNVRSEREVVKHVAAVAPHVGRAVLAHALVVEPVHAGDLTRLVVSPDQVDAVGISHFVAQQQQKRLERVEPAVHKVAEKQVLGVRRLCRDLEQPQQVVQLPVDVAAHRHGGVHELDVGLLDEQLLREETQLLDVVFGHDFALSHVVYYFVYMEHVEIMWQGVKYLIMS
ncbi:hypothetical protein KL921_004526 [Ogataea angusta]|nr:hypothetical protein KL921_004526 [Ogataea angusta]